MATARIFRPPAPKTQGFKAVAILVTLVGGGSWAVYEGLQPPPAVAVVPAKPAPVPTPDYIEVDLRGPFFDQGRYAGWQQGTAAAGQGMALPEGKVLDFQAGEAVQTTTAKERNDRDDYVAGFRAGFTEGWQKTRMTALAPKH